MPISNPTNLSGLALWLCSDAGVYKDTGKTVAATVDGDAVASFADQSGGGNDHTQATSANQPIYKTGIFPSGKPSIRTNGVTGTGAQYLDCANASASTNYKACESGSHTIFFVIRPVTYPAGFHAFYTKNPGGDARFFFEIEHESGGATRLHRYNGLWAAPNAGGVHSQILSGTTYLFAHTFDATTNTESWWINGSLMARRIAAVPASNTSSPFRIGSTSDLTISGNFDIGQIVAYTRVLTATEIGQVFGYLSGWAGVALDAVDNTVRCVLEGHSIAEGYNSTATANGYLKQALVAAGKTWSAINLGNNGDSFASISTRSASHSIPARLPGSRSVYLIDAGINDFVGGSATAAAVEGYFQTTANAARAAGLKVIAFCVLPWGGIAAGAETERQNYNTWLRANYATYADALVDYATDGSGRLNDPTNATYYNGNHPNDAGHAVLAGMVQTALTSLSLPTTGFSVSGGSATVLAGQPTSAYTVSLPSGETFNGEHTVTLGVTDGAVVATGGTTSTSGNSTTVTPTSGSSTFSFTYAPASAGTKTITFVNGQGWASPAAQTVTATDPDSSSSSASSYSSDSSASSPSSASSVSSASSDSSSSYSSASSASSESSASSASSPSSFSSLSSNPDQKQPLDVIPVHNLYPTMFINDDDPGVVSKIDEMAYRYNDVPTIRGPVTVEIESPFANSEIRYTLNGKNPTPHSRLYVSPLVFEQNATGEKTAVKARIYSKQNSNVKSRIIRLEFRVLP